MQWHARRKAMGATQPVASDASGEPTEATTIVRRYTAWPVVDNTLDLFESALDEQARWQLSLWDALILAAARASGASELITEDLNHGQDYGGVRVINPFR